MARPVHVTGCCAFAALLCLPALQMATGLVPKVGLGGAENAVPAPQPPTLASWSDGKWQESIEKWLGHDIGLRDWIVRLDNELRYVVTGAAKKPVTAGRRDYLFEDGYLPGRTVLHEFERDSIVQRMANLLLLQQELDKIGIRLLVCISPSKVRSYPERLPAFQAMVDRAVADVPRHYDLAAAAMRTGGVRFLDFPTLFRQWKLEDPPGTPATFTRAGVHWSNYAAARAAVLLMDEIERLTGRDVVNLEVTGQRLAPGPEGDEADLARMANVLDESRFNDPTPQPIVEHRAGDQGQPLPILFVGTSFVWGLTRTLCPQHTGQPLSVWYYFASRYEQVKDEIGPKQSLDAEKKNLLATLKRYPVIVLEVNENSVANIGHGFIDAALRALGKEPFANVPKGAAELLLQQPK